MHTDPTSYSLRKVESIHLYPRLVVHYRSKGKFVSRVKSLKDKVEGLRRTSDQRAECERRLAKLAQQCFDDQVKATSLVERIKTAADSREFAIPRNRRLWGALGLLPTYGGPPTTTLLNAATAERVVRSANVRVRDLRTGRADEKLRLARGNRSWEEITYENLGRWEKQDVRQLARRRLSLTESKRSKQAEMRRAFETVVSIIREVDGRVPGYTRDSDSAEVRVPSLGLLQTAVELLIGPPVSLNAETSVKWLKKIRHGKPLASPTVLPSSLCPSSVLQRIPEAEREVMRAESARNLGLLKELGATRIPTRTIGASDDVDL